VLVAFLSEAVDLYANAFYWEHGPCQAQIYFVLAVLPKMVHLYVNTFNGTGADHVNRMLAIVFNGRGTDHAKHNML
jgi:hypothetical protein